MRIHEIWIRFYKSFNFDYELKANPGATQRSWQETPDGWMPHVRIPIEPDITAVVGANESGKTHLLDAIRIVLTGDGLLQRDFCRSSSLFSVEHGSRLFPEVGATFTPDESDVEALLELGIPLRNNNDLMMLRPEPGVINIVDAEDQRVDLTKEQMDGLEGLLPYPQELQTNVALPDTVSISALAQSGTRIVSRKKRFRLLSFLADLGTAEETTNAASSLFEMIDATEAREPEAQRLGLDLLTKVARIEASSFEELQTAIAEEREGLVNGLIQEMNNSIARHLNVSRWWSQDPEFQLRVSPREHELVFTIRDRTGTDYSFTERSKGLQYFLSYYVQLLSHDRRVDRPEVLLMDEPDAYLSSSGQQDLLRVLEHHARPEDSDRENQVVYVTHSPFLINRNAGHRVRVVDKGSRDEGTRVVKDATRNHYEPLRTSLGAFVAETAFIGGDNLFVDPGAASEHDATSWVGNCATQGRSGTRRQQRLGLATPFGRGTLNGRVTAPVIGLPRSDPWGAPAAAAAPPCPPPRSAPPRGRPRSGPRTPPRSPRAAPWAGTTSPLPHRCRPAGGAS